MLRYMPASYENFKVEGGDIAPGAWRNEFDTFKTIFLDKKRWLSRAEDIREIFAKYFYGTGQVEWQ